MYITDAERCFYIFQSQTISFESCSHVFFLKHRYPIFFHCKYFCFKKGACKMAIWSLYTVLTITLSCYLFWRYLSCFVLLFPFQSKLAKKDVSDHHWPGWASNRSCRVAIKESLAGQYKLVIYLYPVTFFPSILKFVLTLLGVGKIIRNETAKDRNWTNSCKSINQQCRYKSQFYLQDSTNDLHAYNDKIINYLEHENCVFSVSFLSDFSLITFVIFTFSFLKFCRMQFVHSADS